MNDQQLPQFEQLPPLGGFDPGSGAPAQKKRLGFAIASLVLGTVSMIGSCTCIVFITAPLAIIFGAVALAKKHDGTGLSITGIITGILSLVLLLAICLAFRDLWEYAPVIMQDYRQVIEEQDEVFPAYEEDGTLPDYLKKYLEPPFSDFFAKYDGTFYDIMEVLLSQYKEGMLPTAAFRIQTGTAVQCCGFPAIYIE